MSKRKYEPLWQHVYRIFVNGELVYATTNARKYSREVRRYGVNITTSEPR